MKSFLILVLLVISTPLFCPTCPNGGGILYKGDSIDEVIKQCGEPTSKHIKVTTLLTVKQWVYTINHAYDRGYSRLVVVFKNDQVSTITIYEHYDWYSCHQTAIQLGTGITVQTSCGDFNYNTLSTNICGAPFGVGDSINIVQSICGDPADQTILQNNTTEETDELVYGGNNPQTIVFQDGKLTDFR